MTTSSPAAGRETLPTELCVFDPTPLLTVTIEAFGPDTDIHFHAGGQGFWVARMAVRLGASVCLVSSLAGETGNLIGPLVESGGIRLRGIRTTGHNGAYVQDRRSGARAQIAAMEPAPLTRHEVDDLYGAALAAAGESKLMVITGPSSPDAVPAELYGRLAADLEALGTKVVADVSGEALLNLAGHRIDVLKVSEEDMVRDGLVSADDAEGRNALMRQWAADGARTVLWTRAHEPALVLLDSSLAQIDSPSLQAVDHRGAGDSMTAAIAAALGRELPIETALRLGAAAGAVNVTRHGLGSSGPDAIEAVLRHVRVVPVSDEEGNNGDREDDPEAGRAAARLAGNGGEPTPVESTEVERTQVESTATVEVLEAAPAGPRMGETGTQ